MLRGSVVFTTAVASSALLVGAATAVSPTLAVALVGLALVSSVAVRLDPIDLAAAAVALVPWSVIVGELIPHLLKSAIAITACCALLAVVRLGGSGTWSAFTVRIGAVCFLGSTGLSLLRGGSSSAQLMQATKYTFFVALALLVVDPRQRRPSLASRLWSSGAQALLSSLSLPLAWLASASLARSTTVGSSSASRRRTTSAC